MATVAKPYNKDLLLEVTEAMQLLRNGGNCTKVYLLFYSSLVTLCGYGYIDAIMATVAKKLNNKDTLHKTVEQRSNLVHYVL